MKRIKDTDIIPLIIAPANIRQSIFKVLKGTSRKALREALENGETEAVEKTKYLISARMVSPHRANLNAAGAVLKKGEPFKFFTGYPDMWTICDKLREAGLLEQNVVTIEREDNRKFTEFRFT